MALGHEGLRPSVEALGCWDQAEHERAFREEFALEHISIVQIDGLDVGYLKVEEHGDHLFLAGIYLSALHRRKGLGTELILDLVQRARDESKPLRLRVLRSNPSQLLYERLGFRRTESTDRHIQMELDPCGL